MDKNKNKNYVIAIIDNILYQYWIKIVYFI